MAKEEFDLTKTPSAKIDNDNDPKVMTFTLPIGDLIENEGAGEELVVGIFWRFQKMTLGLIHAKRAKKALGGLIKPVEKSALSLH